MQVQQLDIVNSGRTFYTLSLHSDVVYEMDELLFADVTRMRKTDAVLLSIFCKRANAFDDFVITINGIIRVIGGRTL